MVDADLERGFGLTGDVEVNELTSLRRLNERIVRRTAEVSVSLFIQYIHRFNQGVHAHCFYYFKESDCSKTTCLWNYFHILSITSSFYLLLTQWLITESSVWNDDPPTQQLFSSFSSCVVVADSWTLTPDVQTKSHCSFFNWLSIIFFPPLTHLWRDAAAGVSLFTRKELL